MIGRHYYIAYKNLNSEFLAENMGQNKHIELSIADIANILDFSIF